MRHHFLVAEEENSVNFVADKEYKELIDQREFLRRDCKTGFTSLFF